MTAVREVCFSHWGLDQAKEWTKMKMTNVTAVNTWRASNWHDMDIEEIEEWRNPKYENTSKVIPRK